MVSLLKKWLGSGLVGDGKFVKVLFGLMMANLLR